MLTIKNVNYTNNIFLIINNIIKILTGKSSMGNLPGSLESAMAVQTLVRWIQPMRRTPWLVFMGMARWPVYSPLLARDHDSSWFIMIHHDSSFSTFRLLLQIERDWNHDLVPTAQERRFSHCIWRTLIIRRNSPWKTCSYQTHWPGTRTNFKHEECASRSSSVFVPILTNLNIADPWAN